jgi:hypothetical protein
MNMKLSELINEIITEWSYRVENGMPDATNPIHLIHLGIVLKEMGLSHIKSGLVENLLMEKGKTPEPVKEKEGSFTNPILNKKIKYKNTKGEDTDGIVGNLLRLPAEHPGRKAAEALLPADGTPEREKVNQDLGGQGQPAGAQKPKADKGDDEPAGGGEEEKAKAAQAMFDPKNDPAMAARLDKEKEVQTQLAKDAEEDNEVEKEQEPKEDGEFNPIDITDVAAEMPQADTDTFSGGSDIPDAIDPKELEQFNTDIKKVAQQVADAKAKGEPTPNINLCDVTVPGTNLYCDDNLGIPRDEMPQFKGTAQPGSRAASMDADASGEVDTEPVFREMLAQKGIKTLQTEVPADKLKATQKDLVGAKVVGMMGALEKDPNHPKITAPIYVSRDGYVIDGHHRWAAVVAYNAANPDKQIQMKTTVLDQDIKDAIPMANKFAEDMGIAAKKADANKEDAVQPKAAEVKPNESDPTSNVKTFKGESSGKEIKTLELEGGGFLFGTQHGDTKMADDIINQVKATIPKEKWKDVVFVGEGGATGDGGELEFNDEMEYSAPKFKEMGASIDTWDGDELDVHNDQSGLYKSQAEQTGLSQSKIKAGNWASMIGQGEGTDTMSPNDYLDDEGKEFLQNAAKEAGFPEIENWDDPTEQDKDTLYRLSFPEDNGDTETGVNDVQVAFNKARDLNLIKKQKELTAQGKIPIVMAGESHVDLVDDIMKGKEEEPKGTEKLPEPKEPSTENGGVVYSLGGGYYSDTPNGPAQYRVVESIVEEVILDGNETLAYLLFEATVTKKTAKGKTVKLKTIEPKNQKRATAVAKNKKEADVEEAPDFSKMKPAQLKKYVDDRIAQAEADFDKSKNKAKFAIDFILKRQAEINNNYLRPAGSPASSLGELNGGKYINQVWQTGGNLTPQQESDIINEIMETELAQQIPPKDRKRWAKIALETAKTEVKVLTHQKKYKASKKQTPPYPMGVIMDKQSKAMLKKHFVEMMENATTAKQKSHYKKQLDYIDKLSESDTGVMYQLEDGTIGFKHTSNKSSYQDPHNNTSVDEKIKAMRNTLGANLDPKLEQKMQEVSTKVAEASAGIEDACRKFSENRNNMSPKDRNIQDAIIAKVVSAYPVRGGSTKNYLDVLKDKKWFIDKANELGIETPVTSEKDAVTVAIALAGDTPAPTAAVKVLVKISEMLEKVTPEMVSKMAPAFNLSDDELVSLSKSASILKAAAKTRRDVMGEAHTELVSAIQTADKNAKPKSYPYDKNADNGPHQQAYVKDFLHRMHFSSYIMGERDGVSSQNIGGDNVEPVYYRECLAELSGYTGDTETSDGRQGLVSHLEKRIRISPDNDSISFINGKTSVQLGVEKYRTKGESKSVVSGLGKELQSCLKGKAKK